MTNLYLQDTAEHWNIRIRDYVRFDPEIPTLTESMDGPQHGGGSDLEGYALQEDRNDVS